MKRGLVLDVSGWRVTVITEQGEFCTTRRRGARIGDVIEIAPVRSAWMAVAAACLLLVLFWAWPTAAPPQPLAYITIDINPSFELTVNDQELVIAVQRLDDGDGNWIQGLSGLPVDDAVSGLIAGVIADRFSEELLVVIAVVPGGSDDEQFQRLITAAARGAEQGSKGVADVRLVTVGCGAEVREQAQSVGLSAGRFMVLEQAQADGLSIAVDDIKGVGLGAAVAAAGGNVDQVLARVHEHVQAQRGQAYGIVVRHSPPGLVRDQEDADTEQEPEDNERGRDVPVPIGPPVDKPGRPDNPGQQDEDQVELPVQPPVRDEVPGKAVGLLERFRQIGDWLLRRGQESDQTGRPTTPGPPGRR